MAQHHSIRVCMVSPSIYPLFNPMVRAPFGDSEQQLYELARIFGGDDRIEINIVTGDFGQEDVEFYSGVLVFRGEFESERTWMQRLLRKPTPFHSLLKKIDANVYLMAGASGLAKPVMEFCQANSRSFLFRIAHQRDCDGTFVHGDPMGEAYRWALQRSDFIVCQTEEQKRLLQRTEKLSALRIPDFIGAGASTEAEPADVLWIGEAVEWKQPELFYRLALTIPHQNFTLLTRPNNPEYFERLVSKTRDVPNLGFENSVPYSEWPIFLKRARILVNTSRFEGFPFAFTQAFAYGVPVVSLNVDPDGILEKRQLGICAHGSEALQAQGVMDLISYPRQWKRMSDNALTYSRQAQNPLKIAEAYRRLFQKSAGKMMDLSGAE